MTHPGYNERLFGAGAVRRWLHMRRFEWASAAAAAVAAPGASVCELGCFDGRLAERLAPWCGRYVGIDAGWEGGLDQARARFRDDPRFTFAQAETVGQVAAALVPCDLAVALETLEHLPADDMPRVLDLLADAARRAVIVTIPNELGPPFVIKHAGRLLLTRSRGDFPMRVAWAHATGRVSSVRRDGHVGFDWRTVPAVLRRRFRSVRVVGVHFPFLPPSASFTVGVIATERL